MLTGLTNASLCAFARAMLGWDYGPRQATHDLRRLRRKGLIVRREGTYSYDVTARVRQVTVLFTKTYVRILAPGLAALGPQLPPDIAQRCPLATAWRRFDRALDDFIALQVIAA